MTAKLTFYGGVDEIGGNKILLQTEDGSVLLDFGRRMGEYGKFFSEFLVARSMNALRDMLRLETNPHREPPMTSDRRPGAASIFPATRSTSG